MRGSIGRSEAWAKKQRALLTGAYRQPEKWTRDFEFLPRVEGVVSGTGKNLRVVRLEFVFGEILPNYPAP